MVNSNGTSYPVAGFAAYSFSSVSSKKIIIDLRMSGNTETVALMPNAFNGSESRVLHLKLTSAKQMRFDNGALSGSKIEKIVVEGLNKAEFKKVQRKLRLSGFKGKIVKKNK